MSNFELVMQRGPQVGEVIPLTRETVTIGRDPMSDIVINDPEVSRHQARLMRLPNNGYDQTSLHVYGRGYVYMSI